MEIAIIIPVYNREKLLMRTLQSVLRQTHRPLHLILVDNASTDGSRALMEQFRHDYAAPDFRVTIADEPQSGAAAARNRGLSAADTEWVMFFDSDDEMSPSLVAGYAAAIARNRQADIIYTDVKIVGDDGREQVKRSPRRNLLYETVFHSYLSTQRYIVRKKIVEAAGGWNPLLPAWNDWELGLRLLLATSRAVKLDTPAPMVLVHAHADSITGRRFSDKAGVWERAVDEAEKAIRSSGRKDTALLLDALEYKRIVLAGTYTREGSEAGETLYREVCSRIGGRTAMRFLCRSGYRLISRGTRGVPRIAALLLRALH